MKVQASSGLPQEKGLWVQPTWVWNKPSWWSVVCFYIIWFGFWSFICLFLKFFSYNGACWTTVIFTPPFAFSWHSAGNIMQLRLFNLSLFKRQLPQSLNLSHSQDLETLGLKWLSYENNINVSWISLCVEIPWGTWKIPDGISLWGKDPSISSPGNPSGQSSLRTSDLAILIGSSAT